MQGRLGGSESRLGLLLLGADEPTSGTFEQFGQSTAVIDSPIKQIFGQSQTNIRATSSAHAQSQVDIKATDSALAQSQASIKATSSAPAQSQSDIKQAYSVVAQSQALIEAGIFSFAQSQATIRRTYFGLAQSQAYIDSQREFGQSQAQIIGLGLSVGQSQVYIKVEKYIVQFAGLTLPGYAQEEVFNSVMNIADHPVTYYESSSEYTGLQNKMISLRMRTTGDSYLECKTQVERAATILRSKRGLAKLVIQNASRYYKVLTDTISVDKSVGETMKLLDYSIEFNAKPWLFEDATHTASGASIIETVGRTLSDGGWTPTKITVTGENITISGYTEYGNFTGFISISGAVNNLEIDSDTYTVQINGENKINTLNNLDFKTYVGPGTTFFVVSGATGCSVEWQNRWYL